MKKNIFYFFSEEWPFFYGIAPYVWQLLFFYIPLIFMFYLSFIASDPVTDQNFYSLSHYCSFFKSSYFFSIARSFLLAAVTSICCLTLGYPVAYFLSFSAGKAKNFFLFLFIIPFWTNFLLHIYAWFFVLERGGFLNSILLQLGVIAEPLVFLNSTFAVLLVMIYCYLPFMTLPIYSILERFDKRLIEVSQDLGATSWQTFKYIMLPLIIPGIRSGLFLVFMPAFGDFAIPALLGGDTHMYIGSIIVHFILGADTLSRGAAFTISASLLLVLVIFFFYIVVARMGTGIFDKMKEAKK